MGFLQFFNNIRKVLRAELLFHVNFAQNFSIYDKSQPTVEEIGVLIKYKSPLVILVSLL